MNTTGSFLLFIIFIISSVNLSQPILACDVGLFSSTVNTAFSNNTPSFVHGISELCSGNGIFKSLSSSLNIFFNYGGFNTSLDTENDNPSA